MSNYLEDWGNVIRKQGEANEAARQAKLKRLREELPNAIEALKSKTNSELLALFRQFAHVPFDPLEAAINEQFVEALHKAILERMIPW